MHHFETTTSSARSPWQLFERSSPASTTAALPEISVDRLSTAHNGANTPSTTAASASVTTLSAITTRGINIAGWTITASKGPIANSAQMDTLSNTLNIPPPEMLFPSNTIIIEHPASGFSYIFDAVRALSSVHGVSSSSSTDGMDLREEYERGSQATASSSSKLGSKPKSKGIKVAYAQEWGKSRTEPTPTTDPSLGRTTVPTSAPSASPAGIDPTGPSSSSTAPGGQSSSFFGPGVAQAIASAAAAANASADIADARDYDWTYSNTWPGIPSDPSSSSSSSSSGAPRFQPASDPHLDRIPIEKLGAGSEPILFYDEVVLYEDELADNGSSMLSVKVRVMPSGFLVLQRFLLRVDNVLFRMFDTRMYASFTPPSGGDSGRGTGLGAGAGAGAGAGVGRPGPAVDATTRPLPTRPSPGAGPIEGQGSPTSSSLQEGIARISLGPTRRQMRAAAAAKEALAASAAGREGGATNAGSASRTEEDGATTAGSRQASDSQVTDDGAPSNTLRVIRECAGWEATHAEVKSRLPPYKAWDLSPLTDANWIASTLQSLSSSRSALPPPASATAARYSGNGTQMPHHTPTPAPPFTAARSGGAVHVPGPALGPGAASATILGVVDEDKWEGVGSRIDVALVPCSTS